MAETIKTKLDGCFMLCGTVTIATTATVATGLNRVLCIQCMYAETGGTTDLHASAVGGTVTITGSDKSVYYTIIGI